MSAHWRDLALCSGSDSAAFFADDESGSPREAQALCRVCPVVEACLTHALLTPETHGVWGGTTPAQRESILLDLAS